MEHAHIENVMYMIWSQFLKKTKGAPDKTRLLSSLN